MNIFSFIEKVPDIIIPSLNQKSKTAYLIWREICHMVGSVVLIILSYLIKPSIVVIVFILLMFWMTYQEFYFHPKKYNQPLWKGVIDWLSWILPFLAYFIFVAE